MPTVSRPTVEQTPDALWSTPKTLWGLLATVDHKTVGKRYIVTAVVFLMLGGVQALLIRVQLAQSELRLLQPEAYDQLAPAADTQAQCRRTGSS